MFRSSKPGHDSRGNVKGNIGKDLVWPVRQGILEKITLVNYNIGLMREFLLQQGRELWIFLAC